MAEPAAKSYSLDPSLYIYTSLTSGSSHIVTATSRLETILKANRIPFKAIDIATDEKARMLWGRRAGKDESGRARKIPGLVQMGLVIGDLVEIEDWNEYGELKQHVKIVTEGATWVPPPPIKKTMAKKPAAKTSTKENVKPTPATASKSTVEQDTSKPSASEPAAITLALRQVGQEAAQKAKDVKKKALQTVSGAGSAKSEAEKKSEPEKKEETKKTDEVEKKDEPKQKTEPVKEDVEESAITTPPTPLDTPKKKHSIEDKTVMQSPTSTAWKRTPGSGLDYVLAPEKASETSLSPEPSITHRGSEVSQASKEEIKKIEDEAKIAEEDEDDDEDAIED
ncbi:neurofilament protein H, form H2 [Phlyctema vagabunda]|uniref:Neurofilament protein H, form H2 n=1 Tax=Phlyctema vagabunda TaxID=108571 RepID=A0ABR4P5R8_9HELO